jgi:hypothetical protein
MAQEVKPGEVISQSGIYRLTHCPIDPNVPHEVTLIRGRGSPIGRVLPIRSDSIELPKVAEVNVGEGWKIKSALFCECGDA